MTGPTMLGTASEPLALYVHWPFCLYKCPYCDFNSHVRASVSEIDFVALLCRELEYESERLGPRPLVSIFFGGGTPSLMSADAVEIVINAATAKFPPVRGIEITLEANPTSVEAKKFAAFREAGVNRVSLGVQSLRPEALEFLGRQHSVRQAREAIDLAKRYFPQVSFDMIYARPEQSVEDWRCELRSALSFGTNHLSLYQLTIEPRTAFAARYMRREFRLPSEDMAVALYAVAEEETARVGFTAYEVSNYAKVNAFCQHNLVYWRYQDYLGIGPGAHSRLSFSDSLHAVQRVRTPEQWAATVRTAGHGICEESLLTPQDLAREMLLMGLRLTEGVSDHRFKKRTGLSFEDALDLEILHASIAAGYVERSPDLLRATPEGRLRLNALLGALLR